MTCRTPMIDGHVHIFDPARFPYAPDIWYTPVGGETGTAAQLTHVMNAHGVRHALLGVDFYRNTGPLLARLCELGLCELGLCELGLCELGLWAQVQVQGDQLVDLKPMLADSGAKLLFDHCGRPDPAAGVGQAGFAALLALADTGRACVKLSSLVKCSTQSYPYQDAWPFFHALMQAYTPQHLVWGSDWPFLRAPERIDYGPLLALFEQLVPIAADRQAILSDTPQRLFGFGK